MLMNRPMSGSRSTFDRPATWVAIPKSVWALYCRSTIDSAASMVLKKVAPSRLATSRMASVSSTGSKTDVIVAS